MSKDDENRKAILARRARFMAAALTATTGCDLLKPPQPCLSVVEVRPPDAGTPSDENQPPEVAPRPCLEPPATDPTRAPPQPCLSQVDPRLEQQEPLGTPQPCLKIAVPSARPCLTPVPPPPPPEPPADAGTRPVKKKK